MGDILKKYYYNTVNEFKKTPLASKLIIHAFTELIPTERNRFGFIISILFALFFSLIIGTSPNTVQLMFDFSSTLLDIELAVFGCIFAVYSILLAFLNDSYMKFLSKTTESEPKSKLKKSTSYYESVLFLYFINIAVSGLVLLFCQVVNDTFRLTNNIVFDTILAITLIWVYLSFSFRVFYELKSTIYNTILLFRTSISYKFWEFYKEEENKNR